MTTEDLGTEDYWIRYFPAKVMERALGVVFALVGTFVLALEFWK